MEEGIPAELRRDRMLSMVREREFMRVADLSHIFGISEVTVRADLAQLADHGLLQRVHGGAIVRDPEPRTESTFEEARGLLRQVNQSAAEIARLNREIVTAEANGSASIHMSRSLTSALDAPAEAEVSW